MPAAFLTATATGVGALRGGLTVDGGPRLRSQVHLRSVLSGAGALSGQLAGGGQQLGVTMAAAGGLNALLLSPTVTVTPAFLAATASGAGGLRAGLVVDGQVLLAATLTGTGGLAGQPAGGVYQFDEADLAGTGGLLARLAGPQAVTMLSQGWGRLLSLAPDLPSGGVAGDVVDLSDAYPVPVGIDMRALLVQEPFPIDEGDQDAGVDEGADWGPDVIVFVGEDEDNP